MGMSRRRLRRGSLSCLWPHGAWGARGLVLPYSGGGVAPPLPPRGGACVWLTGWAYQHREAPLFVPSTQKIDVALGILVNAQSPRSFPPTTKPKVRGI